jgi:hypothetical protein
LFLPQPGASREERHRAVPVDRRFEVAPAQVAAGHAGSLVVVEEPIVFWPSERDEMNFAIIESTGLSREEAIRTAITSLAAQCLPVVWALAGSSPTSRSE